MTTTTLDFYELSQGAQRRIMRCPDKEVLVQPRGHGWKLIWPRNAAHSAALRGAGHWYPVSNRPEAGTWHTQPPAQQYAARSGRWGVVAHADGTYTLRRTDCPVTLRLTDEDLTAALNALGQVAAARPHTTLTQPGAEIV